MNVGSTWKDDPGFEANRIINDRNRGKSQEIVYHSRTCSSLNA